MGCKVRAAAASCLDAELGEKHPRSHQGLPPAQGTAARVEEAAFAPAPPQDTQVSAHRKYILAEIKQLIAKAPPRTHRPRTPPDTAAPPPFPTLLEPQAGRASGLPHPWHHHPAARPWLASSVLLRHRTRLHLPHRSCQLWRQGWAFPPSPPCIPAQRLGWSPGPASLPPATPGWQCPCRQQPLPWPRQRHPTAKAQQPHVVPPAPAPPMLRLQVMGLDPAWHMLETV